MTALLVIVFVVVIVVAGALWRIHNKNNICRYECNSRCGRRHLLEMNQLTALMNSVKRCVASSLIVTRAAPSLLYDANSRLRSKRSLYSYR